MIRHAVLALGVLVLMLVPGPARAEELSFIAVLDAASEVVTPPVDSNATGIAQVVLDTATNRARFELYIYDIDKVTMSHIHRAPVGVNGPVIYGFSFEPFASPLTGDLNFNPDDIADLMTGNLYVNVHTGDYPNGEIRGQLEPGALRGMTVVLNQGMSPENETPPIPDLDAGAQSTVILDLKLMGSRVVAGSTVFEVNYRWGTSVTFTGLHIHKAPAGVPGPVLISSGLAASLDSATGHIKGLADDDGRGNITLKTTMTRASGLATFEEILRDPSAFYINLHTTVHPGGAIRGQLMRRRLGR